MSNPTPLTLIELAQTVVEWPGEYQLQLENETGLCYVSLWWRPSSGFELIAEVEYWGRAYPATYLYPAEQDMIAGPSIRLETFKIMEVAEALASEGFWLR